MVSRADLRAACRPAGRRSRRSRSSRGTPLSRWPGRVSFTTGWQVPNRQPRQPDQPPPRTHCRRHPRLPESLDQHSLEQPSLDQHPLDQHPLDKRSLEPDASNLRTSSQKERSGRFAGRARRRERLHEPPVGGIATAGLGHEPLSQQPNQIPGQGPAMHTRVRPRELRGYESGSAVDLPEIGAEVDPGMGSPVLTLSRAGVRLPRHGILRRGPALLAIAGRPTSPDQRLAGVLVVCSRRDLWWPVFVRGSRVKLLLSDLGKGRYIALCVRRR